MEAIDGAVQGLVARACVNMIPLSASWSRKGVVFRRCPMKDTASDLRVSIVTRITLLGLVSVACDTACCAERTERRPAKRTAAAVVLRPLMRMSPWIYKSVSNMSLSSKAVLIKRVRQVRSGRMEGARRFAGIPSPYAPTARGPGWCAPSVFLHETFSGPFIRVQYNEFTARHHLFPVQGSALARAIIACVYRIHVINQM